MAKSRKRSESASTTDLAAGPDQGAQKYSSSNGESRARIAMRAYELYLARGGVDGGDFDDWIAAERELIGSTTHHEPDRGE
jgi:hypothetical protein